MNPLENAMIALIKETRHEVIRKLGGTIERVSDLFNEFMKNGINEVQAIDLAYEQTAKETGIDQAILEQYSKELLFGTGKKVEGVIDSVSAKLKKEANE